MRNGLLAIIFCFAVIPSVCSGKPVIGDIEPTILEAWQPCELLKVTELKKINGIDHGNYYELVYSYKLVFLKDVNDWRTAGICPIDQLNLLWIYAKRVHKQGAPLKKGEYIKVEDTLSLIKSENGWVISQ